MPRRLFKDFIHIFYVTGIAYSFYFYLTTPKHEDMYHRRLWAMETWFIFTMYIFLIWVMTITDKESNYEMNAKGIAKMMKIRERKLFYIIMFVIAAFTIRYIGSL